MSSKIPLKKLIQNLRNYLKEVHQEKGLLEGILPNKKWLPNNLERSEKKENKKIDFVSVIRGRNLS